jgi:hypothetical protein
MALRTADGRDVSMDEWRPVPGFSRYYINRHGDVLGSRGWLLTETYNKRNDTYTYGVVSDAGQKTTRTYQVMLDLAFPELIPPKEPEPETYKHMKRGEWREIPSFPKHQMHATGEVRYKSSRRRVYPLVDQNTGVKSYRLKNEWGINIWSQEWLFGRTYPELIEIKDAA